MKKNTKIKETKYSKINRGILGNAGPWLKCCEILYVEDPKELCTSESERRGAAEAVQSEMLWCSLVV